MDRRAAETLAAAGYDPSRHRGQQFAAAWYDEVDLVLAMDTSNLEDLGDLLPAGSGAGAADGRLRRFRDFDPLAGDGDDDRDVPDPYYGAASGFDSVLAMVERTSEALTDVLGRALGGTRT